MRVLSQPVEEYIELLKSSTEFVPEVTSLAVSGAMGGALLVSYCDACAQTIRLKDFDGDLNGFNGHLSLIREKANLMSDELQSFAERDIDSLIRLKSVKTMSEDHAKELVIMPFLTCQRSKELLKLSLNLIKACHCVKAGQRKPLLAAHHLYAASCGSHKVTRARLINIKDQQFCRMIEQELLKISEESSDLMHGIVSTSGGGQDEQA